MNSKDPTVTALPSCDGHSHRGLHHYEGLNWHPLGVARRRTTGRAPGAPSDPDAVAGLSEVLQALGDELRAANCAVGQRRLYMSEDGQ